VYHPELTPTIRHSEQMKSSLSVSLPEQQERIFHGKVGTLDSRMKIKAKNRLKNARCFLRNISPFLLPCFTIEGPIDDLLVFYKHYSIVKKGLMTSIFFDQQK
jgi:hypothetical protein